jgi:hypothetical protein
MSPRNEHGHTRDLREDTNLERHVGTISRLAVGTIVYAAIIFGTAILLFKYFKLASPWALYAWGALDLVSWFVFLLYTFFGTDRWPTSRRTRALITAMYLAGLSSVIGYMLRIDGKITESVTVMLLGNGSAAGLMVFRQYRYRRDQLQS